MKNTQVAALLQKYPIISDQIKQPALEVVLTELDTVLANNIPGAIVELGCYIGTTSLFMRRLLDSYDMSHDRPFHVYDSFEGLPPKHRNDISAAGVDFQAGELTVSKKQFIETFKKAHLSAPIIHKKWFNQLVADDIPDEIAFAFLDGDFYESILDSLRLVWPRLSDGGAIAIDDYKRETLPGVERAINEYFINKPHRLHYSSNIAIITAA